MIGFARKVDHVLPHRQYRLAAVLDQLSRSVGTKQQRKQAADFREFLLDDGYRMIQFSVYARACVTFARQETHIDRVKQNLPPEGSVRAIFVTRAQWERSFIIHGFPAAEMAAEEMPTQIQLW